MEDSAGSETTDWQQLVAPSQPNHGIPIYKPPRFSFLKQFRVILNIIFWVLVAWGILGLFSGGWGLIGGIFILGLTFGLIGIPVFLLNGQHKPNTTATPVQDPKSQRHHYFKWFSSLLWGVTLLLFAYVWIDPRFDRDNYLPAFEWLCLASIIASIILAIMNFRQRKA